MAKKAEKSNKKQPIAVIHGISWYEESKNMKEEDFIKAHIGIFPFNSIDLEKNKNGDMVLKNGQPKATEKLKAIHKQLK